MHPHQESCGDKVEHCLCIFTASGSIQRLGLERSAFGPKISFSYCNTAPLMPIQYRPEILRLDMVALPKGTSRGIARSTFVCSRIASLIQALRYGDSIAFTHKTNIEIKPSIDLLRHFLILSCISDHVKENTDDSDDIRPCRILQVGRILPD